MNSKDKKTEKISVRCTKREKDIVERQANKAGKSCSQCVIDAVVAGVERRTEKDKKRIIAKVQLQEKQNRLHRKIKQNEFDFDTLKAEIILYFEEENKLWEC